MQITTFSCWDHFRRQLFFSSKFGAPQPYFVAWAEIFKRSKRLKHRLLHLKINQGWSEHPDSWYGFGNFFVWLVDGKIRLVIQHKPGTHLERKKIEVTLSFACYFALSEHDMKGWFSTLLAEKTNGLSKRAISNTLMVNWKKCIKTGGSTSRASIPFTPHLAWDSLWLKALHWSEWQVGNGGDA